VVKYCDEIFFSRNFSENLLQNLKISLFICKVQYSSEHHSRNVETKETDSNDFNDSALFPLPFIGHGLLFEAIMEIRSRHIGSQERSGLPVLLSSPFRDAVFLWQLANAFPSFFFPTTAIMPRALSGIKDYLIIFNCQSFVYLRDTYNGAVPPQKRLETVVLRNIPEMHRLFKRACKLRIIYHIFRHKNTI